MKRRVVITGIGAVTPLGLGFPESWEALKAGVSGIGSDPTGRLKTQVGALKGFRPEEFVSVKDTMRLDRFVQYAAASARMALADAGLGGEIHNAGVVIGSSRGGISMVEEAMRKRPTAYLMSATTVSAAASFVSQSLGAKAHALGISNACASGASAVGEGMRLIRHGLLDMVLAGGAEAPLTPFCIKGYSASGALSKSGRSMPFDLMRDGFVLSEGAAVLVLEDAGSARKRGARVYAEILGYGSSSDAFHQTMPHREGQERAIVSALKDAGITPGEVGLLSAHATSTPRGDMEEAMAIGSVFGPGGVPVTAVKSMTGHMLGASGAVEAAFAAMAISEGVIPPTINTAQPEFGVDISAHTRSADIRVAVSNSFGFGGANSVLVLGRYGRVKR